MFRRILLVALISLLLFPDDPSAAVRRRRDRHDGSRNKSLDLAINGYGLSFGNSARMNGIRLNFRDEDVEEVNGLNITLWKPGHNRRAVIRGISFGLYGPSACELKYLPIGLLSVEAECSIEGIALAGVATVSGGDINGIAVSGIATVADGTVNGIMLAGLANVSEGPMTGISVG
ncbi:MAG TPA: hypothetical protein VLA34_04090, partial [Candidatus Krumholzibacterium sp.]|nr:hypothetical protein [Candidatus Krumholzibacterium sp.]